MIGNLKIIVRRIQEFLERNIVGGFIQDFIWYFKHIYQKEWTKTSLESKDLPHREHITSIIASFDSVQSVLEIGCAAGPNLRLLREKLPSAYLSGIDINKQAIKVANNYFASINDDKVNFFARKADQLDEFQNKSFDVVFSQAVLVCIPPTRIYKVISEMIRLSSNVIIFNEYHSDGADEGFFDNGRWVYDYYKIIKKYHPKAHVSMQESGFKGGSWDRYGKVIIAKLL